MPTTKTFIVEGKTDKDRLLQLLDEPVHIICTHGTLGTEELEELIDQLEGEDIYIWVDADQAGVQLREQLKREFPNATHLYTRRKYKEVADTPLEYLAKQLYNAHFSLKTVYMHLLNTREEV